MSNAPLDPTDQPPASGARPVVFGFFMGALAGVAFVAAGVLRLASDVVVPVASITAILLLLGKPIADRLAAWAHIPRPQIVSAIGLMAMAPMLFLGALMAMGDPILSSHWRCGTGDIGFAMLAPIASFLFGATGALIACVVAGKERRGVDALIRGGRLVALALSLMLLGGGAIRAANRPDPDHYLARLPQVGVLKPVSGDPIEVIPNAGEPPERGPTRVYEDRVANITVRRECIQESCQIIVLPADGAPRPAEQKWSGVSVSATATLTVYRDEKHDLWIFDHHAAFRGPSHRLVDIYAGDVADGLAPPSGWMIGAAIGVVIAAGVGVKRRRLSRRFAAISAAVPGVHNKNGWITLDESLPSFRAAPDLGLEEGPVLIVTGAGAGAAGGAYRADGSARGVEILAGEREGHLAVIRRQITSLDALAMSAQVLTVAPLVAAWVRGLVL